MSYRIKRVAHLTGINPATLRAWERRYNLIAPGRTESGYRVYSDEDVAMLGRIKKLTDDGLTIGEAIARVRRVSAPLPPNAAAPDLAEVRRQLRDALLRFDRQGALAAYERLGHLPPERRAEEALLPVMREIGDLWQDGVAVVAQEHFASGFVREKLAQMMADADTGIAPGPEAVCAGLPGDPHELGLMACALRLATSGWKVVYLGVDVPFDDIRRVVGERKPALLCASMVLRTPAGAVHQAAERLRALAPRETGVVMGGAGIPPDTEPVRGVRFAPTICDVLSAN
ncbi:MAG TPA: MerR family transcriptional regulator [Longimicrobium sp.]|jgi:DNA-binding transcriptional MerR regulator/methylmalonyl-CoA mutase cobalamin-binding subunit